MTRQAKLDAATIQAWLRKNDGWVVEGDSLAKAFAFPDFAAALAFTVRLGMLAESRNHHPDVNVGWGKARVVWTTHDSGGITMNDLELAEATDAFAVGPRSFGVLGPTPARPKR